MTTSDYFSSRRQCYDSQRLDPSAEHIDRLALLGALAGKTVLDVGAGTGRVARIVADKYGANVVALEPSDLRFAAAARLGGKFRAVIRGRAEQLPWADAAFDRVLLQMVIHLVDRPRSLAEGFRVLRPGGRWISCSMNPHRLGTSWLSRLFPSYCDIDARRFPSEQAIRHELAEAGFCNDEVNGYAETSTIQRADALVLLRTKYTSTLSLLRPDEFEEGLSRAERELPAVVCSEAHLLIATGVRPWGSSAGLSPAR